MLITLENYPIIECGALVRSEDTNDGWPTEVPDPYYGGSKGFEIVLDMIEAACPAIVEYRSTNS